MIYMGQLNPYFPPGQNQNYGPRFRTMEEAIHYGEPGRKSFSVGPGTVIGALVGLGIGMNQLKKRQEIESLPVKLPEPKLPKEKSEKPMFSGDFYSDTKNLVNGLSTTFTPIGVMYSLKHKGQSVAIDTIERSEMTPEMKDMWQAKNSLYFKNLMLAKIYSEAQLAEQAFVKQMLSTQMQKMHKKADEDECDGKFVYELSSYLEKLHDIIKEDSNNKIAVSNIVNEMEKSGATQEIELELSRPFEKYAGIISTLATDLIAKPLGFQLSEKRFTDPTYLKFHTDVQFLPDRVLFIVDSNLLGTLSVLNMNEEGYDAFNRKDRTYFKEFFITEAKKGLSQMQMKKTAATEETKESVVVNTNPFLQQDVHPLIYAYVLDTKYGRDWVTWDTYALIKQLEMDFTNGDPVDDIALDKVMAIQTLRVSTIPFESYHAFEKIVRALNGRSLDFFRREQSDLDPSELLFAIDAMQKLTPDNDIYDDFMPEVIKYIADTMAMKELYCCNTPALAGEQTKEAFLVVLNRHLYRSIATFFISGSTFTHSEQETILQNAKMINTIVNEACEAVYKMPKEPTDKEIVLSIAKAAGTIGISKLPPQTGRTLITQVKMNMALNDFLKARDAELQKQMTIFVQQAEEGVTEHES